MARARSPPPSGPGISLMNELLGLAYYAEIPAVIIDVQRVGPSTGMPTRTQQGDLMECAYASHGDTQTYSAVSVESGRVFRFRGEGVRSGGALPDAGVHAVGSRYRHERLGGAAPQLGRFVSPGSRPRARRRADLEKMPKFQRYIAEDENYVAARTLPGVHPKGAFFTRGSGHNKFGGYTETPDEYQEVMDRLLRKHKAAAKFVPAPSIRRREGAQFGVVTLGGCDPAVREALDLLAAQGIAADFMRIRGFPFDESVEAVPVRARVLLRRRAESRRAAALAV